MINAELAAFLLDVRQNKKNQHLSRCQWIMLVKQIYWKQYWISSVSFKSVKVVLRVGIEICFPRCLNFAPVATYRILNCRLKAPTFHR